MDLLLAAALVDEAAAAEVDKVEAAVFIVAALLAVEVAVVGFVLLRLSAPLVVMVNDPMPTLRVDSSTIRLKAMIRRAAMESMQAKKSTQTKKEDTTMNRLMRRANTVIVSTMATTTKRQREYHFMSHILRSFSTHDEQGNKLMPALPKEAILLCQRHFIVIPLILGDAIIADAALLLGPFLLTLRRDEALFWLSSF